MACLIDVAVFCHKENVKMGENNKRQLITPGSRHANDHRSLKVNGWAGAYYGVNSKVQCVLA